MYTAVFEAVPHYVAMPSLLSARIPNLGVEINEIVERIVSFRFSVIIVTCLDIWLVVFWPRLPCC